MKIGNVKLNRLYIETILLIVVYVVSCALSFEFSWLAGLLMIISGTVFYFYLSVRSGVNYLKLSAVFTASWMITIGLANFRLLEYQKVWETNTWFYLCSAHVFFYFFNTVIIKRYPNIETYINGRNPFIKSIYSKYSIKSLSIATFLLFISGILSFSLNVIIKGYVPAFIISSQPEAYFNFYTRWQIFIVASLLAGSLAFYVSMQKESPKWLKRVMLAITIIQVFVVPLLLVQRGTFISAALVLTAVIYLYGSRRFYVLFSCVAMIFGIYIAGSYLRGYSSEQLINFFKPKDVVINPEPNDNPGSHEPGNLNPGYPEDDIIFRLSPNQAFLYSYLTVSHDNFNSSVEKNNTYSYGALQFAPFNVVLRIDIIFDKIDEFNRKSYSHQVLPHLNTFNLISYAFYDFGLLGIVIFSTFWGSVLGFLEGFCLEHKGIFSTMAIGVTLTPIALSFMNPWFSDFSVWLMWGTLLLMFLPVYLTNKFSRNIHNENNIK